MAKKRSKSKQEERKPSWIEKTAAWFQAARIFGGGLVSLLFFLFFLVLIFGGTSPGAVSIPSGNVLVVPVSGVITSDGNGRDWTLTEMSSKFLVEVLDKAKESKDVKAVILEIDSPGGTPVASAEVALAVERLGKPSVAVIREYGTSGALWIAASADRIFAHPLSMTGSIGVTASRLEFGGLLEDYNITYRRLVSAKYKDAGTPWRAMTQEEEQKFGVLLQKIHDAFVRHVASSRNLSEARVHELANGWIYLGQEAVDAGLVDELGSRKDAVEYLERELNVTASVGEMKRASGLMDLFGVSLERMFFSLGEGLGTGLVNQPLISS